MAAKRVRRAAGTKKKVTRKKPAMKKKTPAAGGRVAPKKKTTTKAAGTKVARPRTVPAAGFMLRTDTGLELAFEGGSFLQRLAMRWAYTVRSRRRWTGTQSAYRGLRERAEEDLCSIPLRSSERGIGDRHLQALAEAGVIEVGASYVAESVGWETRILPWEYFLSAATKSRRGDRPFLITRHLARPARSRRPRADGRALIVESGPGELGERFSFESERRLITGIGRLKWEHIASPTAAALRDRVRSLRPHVIHLSGVDAHQGAVLLDLGEDPERRDGFYVAGEDGQPAVLEAEPLARVLNAAPAGPVLVTCNAWNSAARIGALVVAEGATTAIGIQDEIDDTLAELFFASFYRAWTVSGFDPLYAFQLAFQELRNHPAPLRGSGFVLWSGESVLEPGRPRPGEADVRRVRTELERQQSMEIPVPATGERVHELLRVDPRPCEAINYSMLHNNRDLFRSFKLRKLQSGVLRGVEVEVILYVGADSFPYRASFDLSEPVSDVSGRIRVPLTWEFVRSLHETIRTALYVNVTLGGQVVYRHTHPVSLLPVNEWKDNRRDGKWLPSFVLPRDPAVAEIVTRAQRYLAALADDHDVGFDGYQSEDPEADDPYEGVDLQVRAIWSALVCELDLKYINPPPTYSESSQRLRTPSDVFENRHGTCIDLTLLVAGCLEYVEIYPVIFLLQGHAFPGYWRSEASRDRFVEMKHLPVTTEPADDRDERVAASALGDAGQQYAWMVEQAAYPEVIAAIESDDLVPLESVWLTSRRGFADAWEAGLDNLKDPAEFDALLDVRHARLANVTPLPLRGVTR